MRIEVLYFDGCPGHERLLPRLNALLGEVGVADVKIELRRVKDADAAREERFLGSPTVRINGEDIEPDAADRDDFGLKCRLYRTEDGLVGMPPDRWTLRALRHASRRQRNDPQDPSCAAGTR